MKPIELHEKAMQFSFLAKQARANGNEEDALNHYEQAAVHESLAAEFYFDKPELEPTRSILVRSAAILNLKAGRLEEAERFIFWGMINLGDALAKEQLYEALEITVTFKNLSRQGISSSIDYIYGLRKRSILYAIEPKEQRHGFAVDLSMVSDFTDYFSKSFRAYSKKTYRDIFSDSHVRTNDIEQAASDFASMVDPLVASTGIGGFKLAIATDYLPEFKETKEVSLLKANVLARYHDNVFIQELTEEKIYQVKKEFTEEEIEQIFRPLLNIKTSKASYKVSYYDRESLQKMPLIRVKHAQRKALLPPRRLASEDIGQLENLIVHRRGTQRGQSMEVLLRQNLKSWNFDYPTNTLEPRGRNPIILSQEIFVNIDFNNATGFTFSFEDLPIAPQSVKFQDGLHDFYTQFYELIKSLRDAEERDDKQETYWDLIKRLVNNPGAIE